VVKCRQIACQDSLTVDNTRNERRTIPRAYTHSVTARQLLHRLALFTWDLTQPKGGGPPTKGEMYCTPSRVTGHPGMVCDEMRPP